MEQWLIQFAAELTQGGSIDNIPTLSGAELLRNALNITYFLAGIISVITVIIGGIMYITSAGQPASITKARLVITYAVVGLVIVVIAYAITNFVLGQFF